MNIVFNQVSGPAVTANGNSAIQDLSQSRAVGEDSPDLNNLSVILNVTAVSGTTPSLTVEVQWSNDGTTFVSAGTPDTFTAITAAGTAQKSMTVKGRYVRLKYTVSGTTPSFTFDALGYGS